MRRVFRTRRAWRWGTPPRVLLSFDLGHVPLPRVRWFPRGGEGHRDANDGWVWTLDPLDDPTGTLAVEIADGWSDPLFSFTVEITPPAWVRHLLVQTIGVGP